MKPRNCPRNSPTSGIVFRGFLGQLLHPPHTDSRPHIRAAVLPPATATSPPSFPLRYFSSLLRHACSLSTARVPFQPENFHLLHSIGRTRPTLQNIIPLSSLPVRHQPYTVADEDLSTSSHQQARQCLTPPFRALFILPLPTCHLVETACQLHQLIPLRRPWSLSTRRRWGNVRLPSIPATSDRPPPTRPTGLVPRRLGTHSPFFYVKSIFPSVFPAPSPPPSGFSIGECLDDLIGSCRGPTPRVDGRAPLDDSRPIVFEDVDRKASRANSTRHTPGTTEATPETVFCLVASLVYFIILDPPSPTLVSRS